MKTIDVVDSKGKRYVMSLSKAEAMLQLGTNCMLQIRIPEESNYFFDGKVIKLKKKPSERKPDTKSDNKLGGERPSK